MDSMISHLMTCACVLSALNVSVCSFFLAVECEAQSSVGVDRLCSVPACRVSLGIMWHSNSSDTGFRVTMEFGWHWCSGRNCTKLAFVCN